MKFVLRISQQKCVYLYTAASVIGAVTFACSAVNEGNLPSPPKSPSSKSKEQVNPALALNGTTTHTQHPAQINFTFFLSNFCKVNFHVLAVIYKKSLSKKVFTVPSFKHFSDTNTSDSISISLAEDLNSNIFFIPDVLFAPFTKYTNKKRNAFQSQQRGK